LRPSCRPGRPVAVLAMPASPAVSRRRFDEAARILIQHIHTWCAILTSAIPLPSPGRRRMSQPLMSVVEQWQMRRTRPNLSWSWPPAPPFIEHEVQGMRSSASRRGRRFPTCTRRKRAADGRAPARECWPALPPSFEIEAIPPPPVPELNALTTRERRRGKASCARSRLHRGRLMRLAAAPSCWGSTLR